MERWSDLKICTPVVIGSIPFSVPQEPKTVRVVKLPAIMEESPSNHFAPHGLENGTNHCNHVEHMPLIYTEEETQEFTLPSVDWGSSACLAELEKITSRPVQTVPSFLLSATENLYGNLLKNAIIFPIAGCCVLELFFLKFSSYVNGQLR